MYLQICMQIHSVVFVLGRQINKQTYAKTINFLCAGNKVVVKYQAQGEGFNPNPLGLTSGTITKALLAQYGAPVERMSGEISARAGFRGGQSGHLPRGLYSHEPWAPWGWLNILNVNNHKIVNNNSIRKKVYIHWNHCNILLNKSIIWAKVNFTGPYSNI